MRKKSCYGIGLITIVLALLLAVCYAFKPEVDNHLLFSLIVATEESTETIMPWQDENGDFYVFLPSHAQMERTVFSAVDENRVYIEGSCIKNGTSCEEYAHNTPYILEYRFRGEMYKRQITFMQSANVPAMYIDTASGSMKYIHAEKGNEEEAAIRLYGASGTLEHTGKASSIRGRGNNTWESFEKKPYSIDLAESADLLDMGLASEWILLANADDPSHIRNKMVYDFSAEAGMQYSPESCWIDLYLNGEYAGLYLLCERNEVHSERVNISQENGWLVSAEVEKRLKAQQRAYIKTPSGQALRIHYPIEITENRKNEIANTWQKIEKAIFDEDISTLANLIDLDSWVMKYLVEEVFSGPDSGLVSQFFYSDNGVVFAGPVWDYDHTTGHAAYWQLSATNTMYANRLQAYDGVEIPWFNMLYENEEFYSRMIEAYENIFVPMLKSLVENRIEQYAELIDKAAAMNQKRWNTGCNMREETARISSYLEGHLVFLEDIWIKGKTYYKVQVNPGNGEFYGYFYVEEGQRLTELPEITVLDNGWFGAFQGWYYSNTEETFDASEPIYGDVQICAKWDRETAFSYNSLLLECVVAVWAVMIGVFLIADIRRSRKGG